MMFNSNQTAIQVNDNDYSKYRHTNQILRFGSWCQTPYFLGLMLLIIMVITHNMNSLSISLKASLQEIETLKSTIDKDRYRDLNIILQKIENIETLKIKESSANEKKRYFYI